MTEDSEWLVDGFSYGFGMEIVVFLPGDNPPKSASSHDRYVREIPVKGQTILQDLPWRLRGDAALRTRGMVRFFPKFHGGAETPPSLPGARVGKAEKALRDTPPVD